MIILLRLFKVGIYSALGDITTTQYNKHPNFQSINETISEMNANYKQLWGNGKLKEGKLKPLNT